VKHDLALAFDLLLQGVGVAIQHGGQGEPGLGKAAWRGKWKRSNLVLPVQFIDLLVNRAVRRMRDLDLCGIRRGMRLCEDGFFKFRHTGLSIGAAFAAAFPVRVLVMRVIRSSKINWV
jgi:hypothetical protein